MPRSSNGSSGRPAAVWVLSRGGTSSQSGGDAPRPLHEYLLRLSLCRRSRVSHIAVGVSGIEDCNGESMTGRSRASSTLLALAATLIQCYATRTGDGCAPLSEHATMAECRKLASEYQKLIRGISASKECRRWSAIIAWPPMHLELTDEETQALKKLARGTGQRIRRGSRTRRSRERCGK